MFLKQSDRRTTTVPVHAGEEIDRLLLKKIAADIEMNTEEFMKLVDEE
ncbi:MAG: putative RNA binding protein YcfA (HicA-like mRNA interferase family) [Candidatus Nitrosomirales archaeon]